MTTFYAQPYALDHTGFYFDTLEAYEAGMERLEQQGCEEVEIQFIDGDDRLARLADAARLTQGQVALWFEGLGDFEETRAEQLGFLLDCGYSLEDALEPYDEVTLLPGTAAGCHGTELLEPGYFRTCLRLSAKSDRSG